MYLRLSIGGAMGSYEVWSINPVFDPQGEVQDSWLQTQGQAMVNAAAGIAVPSSLLQIMGPNVNISKYRLEGRSNTTDDLLGWAEKINAPQAGTGSVNTMPMQTAVVFSLRTNTPGARGRGRLYFPACAATINTQFRVSSPTPTALTTDFRTWMKNIQAAMLAAANPGLPWTTLHLAVRSKANAATPHVVEIQTGDILDTQRRRRDRVPENYITQVYPGA